MTNDFYYKGILIPKENITVRMIATVCDKINDCEDYILKEKGIRGSIYPIIARTRITGSCYLFCEARGNHCTFGIYDNVQKEFIGLSYNVFQKLDDNVFKNISYTLSRVNVRYQNGIINIPCFENANILQKWEKYKNRANLSKDNCIDVPSAEFVAKYQEKIMTSQELRGKINKAKNR